MPDFQESVKIAKQEEHQSPQWANNPYHPPQDVGKITQRAIDLFMMSKKPNGEMGGIGWWQTANGYTAIALHDLRSGGKHNYEAMANCLKQCESHKSGFINEFNDDTLWWAMCCVHMYSIGGDPWFLEKAKGMWQHIQKSQSICQRGQVKFHDQDMEGACYWTTRPGEGQINAVSTGLVAELGLRLAAFSDNKQEKHPHLSKLLGSKEPKREDYIETARCCLGWILRCRYRPKDGIVLDNIMLKKDKANDWDWSYNTGIAMGACALLYEQTRDEDAMVLACHMARKGMMKKGWVAEDGVLNEPGAYKKGVHDPVKNNDSVGFKSVLMRQYVTLYEVIVRTQCQNPDAVECAKLIKTFVNINFQSQVERNTNGNGQYGPWWSGPFEMPTSHSQMAVLDVMAAVATVNR